MDKAHPDVLTIMLQLFDEVCVDFDDILHFACKSACPVGCAHVKKGFTRLSKFDIF